MSGLCIWEYRILAAALDVKGLPLVENQFNNLGTCGWELVAIESGYAYFRRPK